MSTNDRSFMRATLLEQLNDEEMKHLSSILCALYEGCDEQSLQQVEQMKVNNARLILKGGNYPEAEINEYLAEIGAKESKIRQQGLAAQIAEREAVSSLDQRSSNAGVTTQSSLDQKSAYHLDHCMMDLTSINEAKEIPSLFVFDEGRDQKPSMFMPRGKVCVLASEGGMGKSLLSLHLGISLALQSEATRLRRAPDGLLERSQSKTGFALKPVPTSGKVVMLFAEEDQATCAYRLKQLLPKGHDGRVEESMLRALSGKLIPVPLCGMPEGVDNNLTLSSSQRDLEDSPEERFQQLYSMLNTIAGDDGLDLIVVDPLAQFGGGDFEKDNGEASKLMRQFQRLTSVKGEPTVLLVHHSSKDASRGKGKLSHAVRGASALKDNSRWVGILRRIQESESGDTYLVDDQGRTVVELVVAKSNYGACFLKARYLSHRSEIIAINKPELLTVPTHAEKPSNDAGKSSSKQQSSSARSIPVREARQNR